MRSIMMFFNRFFMFCHLFDFFSLENFLILDDKLQVQVSEKRPPAISALLNKVDLFYFIDRWFRVEIYSVTRSPDTKVLCSSESELR